MFGLNSNNLAQEFEAGMRAFDRLHFDLSDRLKPVYYPTKESGGVEITLKEFDQFRFWTHMSDAISFGPIVIWLLCLKMAHKLVSLGSAWPVKSLAFGGLLLVLCFFVGRRLRDHHREKLRSGFRKQHPPRPSDYYEIVEATQRYETSRAPGVFGFLAFWLFAAGCAFLAAEGTYALWAKIGIGAASALLFAAPVLLIMLHWRTGTRYREMMALGSSGKQLSR
jgi:hypothetical protein